MECHVKITVSNDKWLRKLKVWNCVTDHCHHISKDILKHYPLEEGFQYSKKMIFVMYWLNLQANNKLTLGMIEKEFGKHISTCVDTRGNMRYFHVKSNVCHRNKNFYEMSCGISSR